MAKDGVVSIAIDYKNELNQMIRDYESALTEMASNDKLSKGMKAQFDNTIAELKRFKADMEKAFSELSIGKVDKNSFKAFKQTVNKNFESVRAEIDNLNLAVSTINSQIKILGGDLDISKISSQFKDFQDYVQNINNAIDTMIKKLDGQGVSLMTFDDSAVNQAKSQIKEINKLLKSTDEFSDAKGSKYELFDTDQAQAELDVLARDLKNTLELIEKSESELSNFDKNSIGFEKTINQINILKLKAADLHDSIQQLMDIPDKTGEYTFGDSILISDDNVDKKVSEYEKIVKGTLDEIRESAIKTREELERIVTPTSSKAASAKMSDKLNPNSAELVTGVTIETASSELWKKLSPILEDLQNVLNKNPVVAPVKLVVAPNAVSSEKNGEAGTISKSYSKKYQRELAKTGEDAVIDLEGVYKKTFTSIMDEAVSYSKETISKIQNIFESSPIRLHFDFNEEEFKNLSDALLSSDSGKKIDITGQIVESKKEVNELVEKLAEVNELLNSADSKNFSFKGFDKFAEEISKSLGQLAELQSMLKTLQNIESTLARALGVSSVTDIEIQWQNVSKLIENSIKLDGTFRKNANVDKIASEYNNYLNMGGTNELSSIGKIGELEDSKNIINNILSKVKELNSQKVDTSSVDKADDELKSVSSTLDDVISRLDHMINLTRDIGNTFWKMFKDASVSDVDKQWSSIESKFKSIADESGKINLSKQKKDIQELVEMYQKYSNAGGMKTPFDLTDNAETIKKINKVYEQMNSKKDETSVTNESKNFTKVEDSVNSLTSAINTKTEAIKTEANTMELAARAEVKSIQKIIDALNPLIEKIEDIPNLKIPKEDTAFPSKESNISSGMKDAFPDSSTETKPETEGMEQVEKATEEAIQAKKDFATANEGVQSSIDGSENPLKLEAELMEQIAKSARKAADAKKEFVEANKQVKDSADGSKLKNKKKDKYANIKKVSSDEFLDRYDEFLAVGNKVASQKGGTILGNSVNISYDIENELVNVSAKIKDVDGTWRNFSAKLSSDLQVFPTGFRTITKGINKLDNELANFGKDEIKTQETDEQIQKFKELNTAIDDYASIRKRMANGGAYDNDEENSQKLLKTINEIMGKADGSATILSSKQLSDAQDRLDKINKTISEIQQKNAQNDSNSLLKIQDNATKKLSSYTNASTYTPEFIERVESKITEIKQLKITDPKDVARLKEIDGEIQKIVDDSKLLENKLVKQESHLADIISQMKIYRSENTNMSSSQKKSLNSMISSAEELAHSGKVTAEQIEQIKIAFSGLKAEISETGRTGKNFFSQIRNRLTDINSKFIAQFLSWQDWIMYIRQAAEMVTELNTQIIGLAKVSEDSISKIYADFDSYANIAKEMGSTISDTIAATTAWSKNGYNIPDSKKLAEVSLLYKNVGDGINIDEANESLVSTLKGFKLEADQAEHIVDVFNEVSNNEAISSSGIGEALQRSAASFNAANTSLEKSVALVTATNSVIQDPDKVGNMWKTKFYCLYVQKCA
uniref:Minor tail protein n=1 Tax=Siphoviridae sp. ctiV651 TaxID=2827917 RepID=A0A8S5S4T9_9CAUD|nr:MAG TPA: minor tail protein [Siphoviridae sp. ctiV651]